MAIDVALTRAQGLALRAFLEKHLTTVDATVAEIGQTDAFRVWLLFERLPRYKPTTEEPKES